MSDHAVVALVFAVVVGAIILAIVVSVALGEREERRDA